MILSIKHYRELSLDEFHDIISLRMEVFGVEQQAIYNDLDGYDKQSWHLIGTNEQEKIIATARILPVGLKYPEASFGRVVIDPLARGKKYGHEIVKQILAFNSTNLNEAPMKISAMKYLQPFYESHGFIQTSEIYLDCDIEHIDMIRK